MSQQPAPHGPTAAPDLINPGFVAADPIGAAYGLVAGLVHWAAGIEAELRRPEPRWQALHEGFFYRGAAARALDAHRHLLDPFARVRTDAVVWRERGWASWHHAAAEALGFGPDGRRHKLVVWVGTNPDAAAASDVVAPDELNWLEPDLGGGARYCTREEAWRRLRFCAGIAFDHDPGLALCTSGMLGSGWGHFRDIGRERWTLVPHLRSEHLAARRAPASAGAPPTPPTIWYHGEQTYSSNGGDLAKVTDEQHALLEQFLDRDVALQTGDLKKGDRRDLSVGRVVGEIESKYDGRFRPAVTRPGKKKTGYVIRVRTWTA